MNLVEHVFQKENEKWYVHFGYPFMSKDIDGKPIMKSYYRSLGGYGSEAIALTVALTMQPIINMKKRYCT